METSSRHPRRHHPRRAHHHKSLLRRRPGGRWQRGRYDDLSQRHRCHSVSLPGDQRYLWLSTRVRGNGGRQMWVCVGMDLP
jgi:hypothetical protein